MEGFGKGSGWKIKGSSIVLGFPDGNDSRIKQECDSTKLSQAAQQLVFDAIMDSEEHGLTDEEISIVTGLSYVTAKARRVELTSNKFVTDNGETRKGSGGVPGKVHIFSLSKFMDG